MLFEVILFFGGMYVLVLLLGRMCYEEGMEDD